MKYLSLVVSFSRHTPLSRSHCFIMWWSHYLQMTFVSSSPRWAIRPQLRRGESTNNSPPLQTASSSPPWALVLSRDVYQCCRPLSCYGRRDTLFSYSSFSTTSPSCLPCLLIRPRAYSPLPSSFFLLHQVMSGSGDPEDYPQTPRPSGFPHGIGFSLPWWMSVSSSFSILPIYPWQHYTMVYWCIVCHECLLSCHSISSVFFLISGLCPLFASSVSSSDLPHS